MAQNNPIGVIKPTAKETASDGYLMCDGASYLRSQYPALFSVIGTLFGSVDSDHFNVPNGEEFTMMMYDESDPNFNVLGRSGGAKDINLSHSHTMNDHTHSASGTTGNNNNSAGENGTDSTTIAQNPHTHNFTLTTGTQTDKGSSSSLSATQSILNPFITMNWMIKAI